MKTKKSTPPTKEENPTINDSENDYITISQKQSKRSKIFNWFLALFFTLAVLFTFTSYLANKQLQMVLIVFSYICLITFFVLLIAKNNSIKTKKPKQDNQNK